MSSEFSIFSFFSGCGILDLGFENAGFSIRYINENHSPFLKAYEHSREVLGLRKDYVTYHGDFLDVLNNPNSLDNLVKKAKKNSTLVGFIGGPPCPDFSIGGKNQGRNGNTGHLSEAYMELIIREMPDFFLYENVKGLLRTRRHRMFYEEIKRKVESAGYITTENLINAMDYGVPQDRERIILLGFRSEIIRDLGIKFSLSNDTFHSLFPWNKELKFFSPAIRKLDWKGTEPFAENSEREFIGNLPLELTVEHWFRKNQVSIHPNASQYFKPRSALLKFQTIDEGDVSRKSFKRLHRWRYSPTASYGNNEVHLHPYQVRRLSVAEALAIQSLPKEFVFPEDMSLSDMFKSIGNGVPYLAALGIANSLLEFLSNNYNTDDLVIKPQPLILAASD